MNAVFVEKILRVQPNIKMIYLLLRASDNDLATQRFCHKVCKVEFNQPSCWLYSVPNLLVFQQLVTLYLGGILIRVVSEIV